MRRALKRAARLFVAASALGLVSSALAQSSRPADGGKWPAAYEERVFKAAYVTTGTVLFDDEVAPPPAPALKPMPAPTLVPSPAKNLPVPAPPLTAPLVNPAPLAPPPAVLPPLMKPAPLALPPAPLPLVKPAPVTPSPGPLPPLSTTSSAKATADAIAKALPPAVPATIPSPRTAVVKPVSAATAPAPLMPPPNALAPKTTSPIEPLPNIAASKLRHQVEIVCGKQAWEVQVLVKQDQLMHVRVKVPDTQTSAPLTDKIMRLPEMAAPNVRLEIEPLEK
jgi:hypothetical protein